MGGHNCTVAQDALTNNCSISTVDLNWKLQLPSKANFHEVLKLWSLKITLGQLSVPNCISYQFLMNQSTFLSFPIISIERDRVARCKFGHSTNSITVSWTVFSLLRIPQKKWNEDPQSCTCEIVGISQVPLHTQRASADVLKSILIPGLPKEHWIWIIVLKIPD